MEGGGTEGSEAAQKSDGFYHAEEPAQGPALSIQGAQHPQHSVEIRDWIWCLNLERLVEGYWPKGWGPGSEGWRL